MAWKTATVKITFYCFIGTPQPEAQVSVFVSFRDRVTQLYLRAFGSMEIVFKHVRYFIKGHLV
jgi:hypothetical protein